MYFQMNLVWALLSVQFNI